MADRRELLALRKTLDGYRRAVETPSGVGLVRHETDYEVIARLATTRTMVSEFVVDETGRPLGRIVGSTLGMKYMVQTDDAHGRAYAKGFWSGLSYTEGRDGAVIGTPSYDRNGAKVGSDSFGSGGVQSWGSVRPAMPSTPKPEPLTDQRRDELRATGRKAHAHGGKRPDPMAWSVSLFAASLDEVLELQHGWDEADASVRGLAPKPIRLHAGQTWARGVSEYTVTLLHRLSAGPVEGPIDFMVVVDADGYVVNDYGWRLVAGPGFTG